VGLRPASRDHQPIIGWSGTPGLFVATGHYRHGIMLSAATAHAAADALTGGSLPALLSPFQPSRFTREAGTSAGRTQPVS
jgi:glycine oxidase